MMWTARIILLWAFAVCAAYYDLRYRRIPNRLILTAAAGGTVLAAAGGWSALRSGLGGMALGLALLFPFFLMRMVGGGDVKTLAVTGIVTGPGLLWFSFACGVAVGGAVAVLLLAAGHGRRAGGAAGSPGGTTSSWTLPYAGILSMCAAVSALFL